MGFPTAFRDDAANTAREAEVPLASFVDGCNIAGSNACGLGINIDEGAVVGTPNQFTLLDQRGIARVSQISQSIGGYPYVAASAYPSSGGTEGTAPDAVIYVADPSANGDGTAVKVGQASLVDLAVGWVAAP
jgi:hypothetical protein